MRPRCLLCLDTGVLRLSQGVCSCDFGRVEAFRRAQRAERATRPPIVTPYFCGGIVGETARTLQDPH